MSSTNLDRKLNRMLWELRIYSVIEIALWITIYILVDMKYCK